MSLTSLAVRKLSSTIRISGRPAACCSLMDGMGTPLIGPFPRDTPVTNDGRYGLVTSSQHIVRTIPYDELTICRCGSLARAGRCSYRLAVAGRGFPIVGGREARFVLPLAAWCGEGHERSVRVSRQSELLRQAGATGRERLVDTAAVRHRRTMAPAGARYRSA